MSFDTDVIGVRLASSAGRQLDVDGRVTDLANPLDAGLYVVEAGSVHHPNELNALSLSRSLAAKLNVRVGDAVTVGTEPTASFVLTAVVHDRYDLDHDFFVIPPVDRGSVLPPAVASARIVGSPRWFVAWPVESGEGKALARLRASGYDYTPRSSAAALASPGTWWDPTALFTTAALLAEVALVVTAAFAVVLRSQKRTMALLAIVGAPPRFRRVFSTLYAGLSSTVAALVGLAAGVGLGRVIAPALAARAGQDWGAFATGWPTDLFVTVLTFLAAQGAVLLVDRRLARQDIVHQLSDVTPDRRSGRAASSRTAALMGLLATIGVAANELKLFPSGTALFAILVLFGGVVALTLVTVSMGARFSSRAHLPVPSWLTASIRSLMAFPSRAGSTIAAIGAVAGIATCVIVMTSSVAVKQVADYVPSLPSRSVLIGVSRPLQASEVAGVTSLGGVANVAGPFRGAVVKAGGTFAPVSVMNDFMSCVERSNGFARRSNDWSRCYKTSVARAPFPAVAIADADFVRRVAPSGAASSIMACYEAGRCVAVLAGRGISSSVRLVVIAPGAEDLTLRTVASLPGAPVDQAARSAEYTSMPALVMSPAAAQLNGIEPQGSLEYLVQAGPGHRIDAALVRRRLPVDLQASATIASETGPPFVATAARLSAVSMLAAVLTCVLIATSVVGLWLDDLKAEFQMLGALGASTAWRRRVGAGLAAIMAGAGSVVGIVSGVFASAGFLTSLQTPVSVPGRGLILVLTCNLAVTAAVGYLALPKAARAMRRA